MRKIISAFFLFFAIYYTFGQQKSIGNIRDSIRLRLKGELSDEEKLSKDISHHMSNWIMRGEFEKKIDYDKRINDKQVVLQEIVDYTIDWLKGFSMGMEFYINKGNEHYEYDVDNEILKINVRFVYLLILFH